MTDNEGTVIMGYFGDAWDATGGKVVDVIDEGLDAATEALEDIVDETSDVVAGVGGAAWGGGIDATSWFGDAAITTIGHVGGAVGPTISFAATTVNVATGGLAEDVLEVVDDYVLDTVDAATGGVIDIDYDDGQFTSSVGIDDVVGIGLSIGEDGITAESETFVGGFAMGATNEGVGLAVSAGVPGMMPLPYVESHMEVGADGDVSIAGEVQGVIPTPYGLLAGQASGGFEMTDEGWMATGQAAGTLYTTGGVEISGAVGMTYAETDDGSYFDVSGSASIGNEFGTVGVGGGYTRIEEDGVVVETGYVRGDAEGFGIEAGVRSEYVGIETEDGSISVWDTTAQIEGLDQESVIALGTALLGQAGVDVPDSVDEIISALGEGGTQDLIEQLGESDQFNALVGSLGGEAATALVEKIASDGTSGEFMSQLGDAATSVLISKASDSDALEDLLGGLDAEQTADLVRSLSAAATGQVSQGVPASEPSLDTALESDDLLGTAIGGITGQADEIDDSGVQLPVAAQAGDFEQVTTPIDDEEDPLTALDEEGTQFEEQEPTSFESALSEADDVQDSIDDLFDELE